MVWGGISYDGSTDLYVIRNGSLTGIRYRDEFLAPIVRFYDFGSCELVFEIQPEESLTIHKRVHLLALVGSLASFSFKNSKI
jgi:hypothetical protein